MKKYTSFITAVVFITIIFGLTLADLMKADSAISIAERRKLAQLPEFSLKTVLNGRFSQNYAAFLEDQVVFRDNFRTIKALAELKLLQKGENNDVYIVDDGLYDKFYGINQRYITRAASLINDIIEAIDPGPVYLSVIPSKAQTLDRTRYLLSDQNQIADELAQQTNAAYIDIMDLFQNGREDLYYRTDIHWTTPGAIQAYETVITAMGYEPVTAYDFEEITNSFAGSNYGLAALPFIEKDKIYLAHNESLDNLSVCRYETAETWACFESVYFPEKIKEIDAYDVFLGGTNPIIIIENQKIQSEAELFIFKDSYAHVLAPLLAQHFKKVTLFDLRYVQKDLIFDRFDLSGKRVLFLYSTTILNTNPQILN